MPVAKYLDLVWNLIMYTYVHL